MHSPTMSLTVRRLAHMTSFLAMGMGLVGAVGLAAISTHLPSVEGQSIRLEGFLAVVFFLQFAAYLKSIGCLGDCVPDDPDWLPTSGETTVDRIAVFLTTLAILLFGVSAYLRAGLPLEPYLGADYGARMAAYKGSRDIFFTGVVASVVVLQVATFLIHSTVARRFQRGDRSKAGLMTSITAAPVVD